MICKLDLTKKIYYLLHMAEEKTVSGIVLLKVLAKLFVAPLMV